MDDSLGRLLNVSLLAGSGAHRAYYDRSGSSVSELTADELAAGFPPRPALNLRSSVAGPSRTWSSPTTT
jgi:hypothetical protein